MIFEETAPFFLRVDDDLDADHDIAGAALRNRGQCAPRSPHMKYTDPSLFMVSPSNTR